MLNSAIQKEILKYYKTDRASYHSLKNSDIKLQNCWLRYTTCHASSRDARGLMVQLPSTEGTLQEILGIRD